MIYPYICKGCGHKQEIIKSMHDASNVEQCEMCDNILTRVYCAPHIIGAAVQHAEYNPGLGCVIKNKKHRAEVAKRKGLVEIGNDSSAESIHKEAERTLKDKHEKSWESV